MSAQWGAERPRCPECGAAHDPEADRCPLCLAPLPRRTAAASGPRDGGARSPGRPARVRRRRVKKRRLDLSASTARVEETVAAMAQPPPRPPPRPAAAPTIVLAGLVCATGLILFPVAFLVGWFTLVSGIALLAAGILLRYPRPRQ